jgi:hypothetical protein
VRNRLIAEDQHAKSRILVEELKGRATIEEREDTAPTP